MKAEDVVAGLTQIVSLPDVFIKLDAAINDPCSTYAQIAEIIRDDTGLSSRLLRIVNSPFYGFPAKIDSISHAMALVGTNQLRDLALATSVMQAFADIDTRLISMEAFWRHSIATGVAAKVIGSLRREAELERFFLLGVLHDIGRLVLLSECAQAMTQALQLSIKKQALLYRCERAVLGFDHTQVGQALLKTWRLPPVQQAVVAHHHTPRRTLEYAAEVNTIHLADILVNALRLGSSGERFVPPLEARSWSALELEHSELGMILDRLNEEYEAIAEVFLS